MPILCLPAWRVTATETHPNTIHHSGQSTVAESSSIRTSAHSTAPPTNKPSPTDHLPKPNDDRSSCHGARVTSTNTSAELAAEQGKDPFARETPPPPFLSPSWLAKSSFEHPVGWFVFHVDAVVTSHTERSQGFGRISLASITMNTPLRHITYISPLVTTRKASRGKLLWCHQSP